MANPGISPSGKRQNVYAFTGQIRASSVPVGTCFVISRKRRLIVTSRHVIREVTEGSYNRNTHIDVYFPQVANDQNRLFDARIVDYVAAPGADLVVLKLEEDALPSEIGEAVLGRADQSFGRDHNFMSFGYRQANQYFGLPVRGGIGDFVQIINAGDDYQEKLFRLQTPHLSKGMGGAPVLDWERNLVVGMVSIAPFTDETQTRDLDVGLAVDLSGLERLLIEDFNGFYPLFYIIDSPSLPSINPNNAVIAAQGNREFPIQAEYHGAPDIPDTWLTLHHELSEKLKADWVDPKRHVVAVIGASGIGKNTLAHQLVKGILQDDTEKRLVDGFFWWNFNDHPSVSFFLQAAVVYLAGKEVWKKIISQDSQTGDPTILNKGINRKAIEVIAYFLRQQRLVFVLYGVEKLLTNTADHYGIFQYPKASPIQELLDFFTDDKCKSFCLITSTIPLIELIDCDTYDEHTIERLDNDDAIRLIENIGVHGERDELKQLINNHQGHTLSLSLIAATITLGPSRGQLPREEIATSAGDNQMRVRRILRFCESRLTPTDLLFMRLFSIFRMPVPESAILRVFRETLSGLELTRMRESEITNLTQRLVNYHLLRRDADGRYYTHPLVMTYYREQLDQDAPTYISKLHINAARYYAGAAKIPGGDSSSLAEVMKVEMVYHIRQTGEMPDDLHDILKIMTERSELVGDRYLITPEPLGEGGFGKVYRAFDVQRQGNVALKLIRPDKLSPETIRRFEREVQAIKDLVDPHIIPLLDYKIDASEIYLVMPLLNGLTLRQKIDAINRNNERLSPPLVGEWIAKIGGALQTAHNAGIIHRDVKPSNIVFNPNDEPYLVDFGLAKKTALRRDGNAQGFVQNYIAGTPDYMAPEVRSGEGEATEKSDQYSLALVAYELLTGTHDRDQWHQAYLTSEVRAVLDKALSDEPNARYDTIMAFVHAFSPAVTAGNTPPTPTPLSVPTPPLPAPIPTPHGADYLPTITKPIALPVFSSSVSPPTPPLSTPSTAPVVPDWKRTLPFVAGGGIVLLVSLALLIGAISRFVIAPIGATNSPTPTVTVTSEPTRTPTRAASPSPTMTLTRTVTATRTPRPATSTLTFTPFPTVTDMVSLPTVSRHTPTYTPSMTRTPTHSPTDTPTRILTAVPTATFSITPTSTQSNTPAPATLDEVMDQLRTVGSAASFNCARFNNLYEYLEIQINAEAPLFIDGAELINEPSDLLRQLHDSDCRNKTANIALGPQLYGRFIRLINAFQIRPD